jgi:phosphotransferase system HPr (HPr) family protein
VPLRKEIIIQPVDDKTRRQTLERFHSLLSSKTKEADWQTFFEDYPFVFSETLAVKFDGLYCQVPLISGRPDFIFCQKLQMQFMGDYGVIEIKRPTDSIIGTYSSKFIIESKALRVAIKEASSHLNALCASQFLNPNDSFAIGNRRYAFIIIGSSAEVAKKCQTEFLQQQFRNLLPAGLQLYTYDELLRLFSSTVPPITQVLFASQADVEETELSRSLRVKWNLGIHGRPAYQITRLARRVASKIYLNYGGEKADARNIIEIMMLGIPTRTDVVVTAKGRDAKTAIECFNELFENEFFMEDLSYRSKMHELIRKAVKHSQGRDIGEYDDTQGFSQ